MKYLILPSLLLLILSTSCGKVESSAGKLSDAEIDALKLRYSRECIAKSEDEIKDFKEASDNIFSATEFNRNKTFISTYTIGSNESGEETTLQVWKQTADEIYFVETGDAARYIRITRAQNEEMIDDLFKGFCSTEYEGSLVGRNALSHNFELTVAGLKVKVQDAYNSPLTHPAAFANYNVARTKTTIKADGTEEAKTYKKTLKVDSEPEDFGSNTPPDLDQYCTFKNTDPYKFQEASGHSVMGFVIECESTPPADWNLSV